MTNKVEHPKYGTIVFDENAWTGRKKLTINGQPCNKLKGKEYMYMVDGKTKIIQIKGNFLLGAKLIIDQDEIALTPPCNWYEIALSILPFIVVMIWGNIPSLIVIVPVVGGAIGGAISGLISCFSLFTIRSIEKPIFKVLIALGFVIISFLACFVVALAIIPLLI